MTKCEHWSPRLCSFLFVCFGAGSSWNHPKGKITGARTPIAKVWFETKEMIRTAFQAKKHFWTERIYVNKEAFQEKGHFLKFKISAACDWVEISPKPFLPCISCKPPIIWRDISKNNFASVKNRLAMFFPVVGWKDNRGPSGTAPLLQSNCDDTSRGIESGHLLPSWPSPSVRILPTHSCAEWVGANTTVPASYIWIADTSDRSSLCHVGPIAGPLVGAHPQPLGQTKECNIGMETGECPLV